MRQQLLKVDQDSLLYMSPTLPGYNKEHIGYSQPITELPID